MKAISLHQPWASLIGRGKMHETRSWMPRMRGPIAIHAAKLWTQEQFDLYRTEPFASALPAELRTCIYTGRPALPLGAVVAIAYLVECIPTSNCLCNPSGPIEDWQHYIDPIDWQFGDYSPGRYAWQFDKVYHLPAPIYYRGAQGIFSIPDEMFGEEAIEFATNPQRRAIT